MSEAFIEKAAYDVGDLLKIMELLRAENGCPWDREQDHASIRKNLLEESYEACEAIDNSDPELLREELGDVLLQVVFHSRIEQERGGFDFDSVCDGICKKLIVRHPHVFGEITVSGSGEVLANWDKIKARTKGQATATETLRGVTTALPALMRSEKVQHRAAKAGFDYPDLQWAMNDLVSEVEELKEAIAEKDQAHIDEELGDLLFAAVNVARFSHTDPENALTRSCEKFIGRFEKVEQLAVGRGLDMKQMTISELDELWKQAKKNVLSQA